MAKLLRSCNAVKWLFLKLPLSFFHKYFPAVRLSPFQNLLLNMFSFPQPTHYGLRGLDGSGSIEKESYRILLLKVFLSQEQNLLN